MNSQTLYYYVNASGETDGPVAYSDLESFLQTGSIKPSTLVCKFGDSVWAPLLPSKEDRGISTFHTASDRSSREIVFPAWVKFVLWALLVSAFLNFLSPILINGLQKNVWEYRVMHFPAENAGDLSPSTVKLDISELQEAGKNGWEIVGQWVEHETVFPNFGKEQYVTGLQPNFRVSQLSILLKRKISFFPKLP
jgi:hypothetical protein